MSQSLCYLSVFRLDLQTGHTSDRHMLEFRERSKRIASAIAENADWYITKVGGRPRGATENLASQITSMSTIHREYQAMQALRRSPLLKWVLNDIEVEEGQCDVSPKAEQRSMGEVLISLVHEVSGRNILVIAIVYSMFV